MVNHLLLNTRQIFVILTGFILIFVGACSDPKAANEGNFKKALQDYLNFREARGDYCMGGGKYPFNIGFPNFGYADPDLEKIGLIKDITPPGQWPRTQFDLTDKGRQFFTPDKGFCYGKPVVINIINFSEPSSGSFGYNGKTISEVKFEYRMEGAPAWAIEVGQNGSLHTSNLTISGSPISVTNPVKEGGRLILTNKGWVHEMLFEKN